MTVRNPPWLQVCSSLLAALLTGSPSLAAGPNIIHIFADDLGKTSVGVHGQLDRAAQGLPSIQTPHLDALAGAGMIFERAYSATICSPSRGMLYLGFNQVHNANDRNTVAPRAQDVTLAEVLKPAGYTTGVFGKWGYGGSGGQQTSGAKEDDLRLNPAVGNTAALPTTHGYDEFTGYLNHSRAHRYFTSSLWTTDPTGQPVTSGVSEQLLGNVGPNNTNLHATYTHDVVADRTEQFITDHYQSESPFFMQVNYTIPHNDLEAIQFLPDWFADYDGVDASGWTNKERYYAAMITRMDASIGSLVATLEDPNGDGDTSDSILDSTMIVFTSDNGATNADFSNAGLDHFGLRDDLRGGKRDLYEGGINMPQFIRWDGVVPAGSSTDHLTDLTDFMATVVDLAGVDAPVGIDGHSLAPLLTGEGKQRSRDYLLFEHHEGDGPDDDTRNSRWAIIRGDHKLIRFSNGDSELFNLAADPREQSPLNLGQAANAALADELATIALTAGVEQGADHDHEYAVWAGADGDRLADANAWNASGAATAPTRLWSAVVNNPTATESVIDDDAGVTVLGLEVRGDGARQTVRVAANRTLTGLNEVRLKAGGRVQLDNSELHSQRWIDVRDGAELTGQGDVTGDLYNAGVVAPGLPADLQAPPALDGVDTGVVVGVQFDFTGVQDDAPLNQTSIQSEFLTVTHGLDFGPGLNPRNAADAGNEFNVAGFINSEPGSLADAIAAQDYLTFSVAPVSGVTMLLDTVAVQLWRNGNGAAEEYAILTSLDGFADGAQIGQIDLDASDTSTHLLSGTYTGGQSVTGPLEVRVYGWDANGASGNTHFTGVQLDAGFESTPGVPLSPTGRLTLDGDYTQLSSGELVLEIAGDQSTEGAETDFDQVVVVGYADLAGTLSVSLADGFYPEAGTVFELLHADAITGQFENLDLPALAGGLSFAVQYTPNSVRLVVEGVIGDYNHDGFVSAADFAGWRGTVGAVGAGLGADGSGDGLVAAADYAAWQGRFGQTVASSATALPVPEPAAAGLAAIVVACTSLVRPIGWTVGTSARDTTSGQLSASNGLNASRYERRR